MEQSSIKMYERVNNVDLPSTASYQLSNLSFLQLNGKDYMGVIHKGEFVIVCINKEIEIVNRVVPKLSPQQMILKGSWIWPENPVLVLITTSAIQIFDWDGAILLHTHHANAPANNSGASFLKGIVGLPSGRICIGMHTGEILLLNLKDSNNLAFIEEGRLKWFSYPVMALAGRHKIMAAAGAKGDIIVADDEDTLDKRLEINPSGYEPCITCIEILNEAVIAGYLTGHVRIFSALNGLIKAEVCAHARNISSLDIAKASGMLLTVSEDSFARIWKLDLNSQTLIEHKFSQSIKNALLVGGRFANENGTEFLLSSYDLPFLVRFAM